jgi:hypothetical protein
MKAKTYFERIYELLEQFDFNELSERDRIFVLSKIDEEEYINMRSTIKDTETFFSNSSEPNINDSLLSLIIKTNHKPGTLIKILGQPVKLYQLAASIVLILAIYTIKQYSNFPDKNSVFPLHDTVFIQKADSIYPKLADTVYSKLVDTVKSINDKILYISREKDTNTLVKLLSNTAYVFDSSNVVFVKTTARIKELTFIKDVSSDTLFKN